MKNIIISIIFTLILISCNQEFIEIDPVSTVSVDAVYKTDKDFQDAVIGVYKIFQPIYQEFWQYGDLRSDDGISEIASAANLVRMSNFTIDQTYGTFNTSWTLYYSAIYRINFILEKIESADEKVINNKNRHIGEVKFLRALAYFDLVRIFGDVPLISSAISTVEAFQLGREDYNRIYDEIIIPDLRDAIAMLPLTYSGQNVGRVTKGAAISLLGKIFLTRKDFQKAEIELQKVTMMGYKLLDDYNKLWDYNNEHHSEYIFDIEYEQGFNSLGSLFPNYFSLKWPLLNDFYGISGQAEESISPTQSLWSIFSENDLRKDVTVANGIKINGKWFTPPTQAAQNFTKKYMDAVRVRGDSRVNWKVIRYADVLLMYSEALNENGKTLEAFNYLNQVRTRASLTGYSNLSKDETREKIYLERRLELAFEGHRWFDLIRTGRALSVMASFGMRSHNILFPVPLRQVELYNNLTIFPQNPGY